MCEQDKGSQANFSSFLTQTHGPEESCRGRRGSRGRRRWRTQTIYRAGDLDRHSFAFSLIDVIVGKSVPASNSVSDPFKAFAVANNSIRRGSQKRRPT